MKTYLLVIGIMFSFSFPRVVAQNTKNSGNISNIITLKIDVKNQQLNPIITLKPTVNEEVIDDKFRRRFEYIIYNKTNFSNNNYKAYYPDTLKMKHLFHKDLKSNQKASHYISIYYDALENNLETQKKMFTERTLMRVASKFFLVTGNLGKDQLDWRVCISIKGQEETIIEEDYTLLEGFCFEAIFENLRNETQNEDHFMNRFLNYINIIENEKLDFEKDSNIMKSRSRIFDQMASDLALKTMLLKYYRENKSNLPFYIH